jgi:putative ABC transport system permease protein
LAWLNLIHNPRRLLLFSAGICFAVVLMFVQLGCRNALLDSSVLLIEQLRADLVMRSRQETTLMVPAPFPREVLARARAVDGVAEAHPLYLEYSSSWLRHTAAEETRRQPNQTIRVIGVDPDAYLLRLPELDPDSPLSRVNELKLPGRALFDSASRSARDRPAESVYGPLTVGTETELSSRRITLVGPFRIGVDFATDGSLIVSNETFGRDLRPAGLTGGLESVDLGLIRLAPGANPSQVKTELQALLADSDVEVLSRAEFAEHEKRFWLDNTPIGYVFGFGMFMGFLVGLVICYQILSSNIGDNLAAYATLRAIGYRGRFLVGIVLQEAVLLACLGFVPGLLISLGVYRLLASLTDLPVQLTLGRGLFILALTVSMCVGSGLLAARRARQADPAEVF